MSERDSVHKDIEKMQEELKEKNKKLSNQENRSKHYEDDKRKLSCKIEMLKRELEQSLHERDKAMKETHEIRSVMIMFLVPKLNIQLMYKKCIIALFYKYLIRPYENAREKRTNCPIRTS